MSDSPQLTLLKQIRDRLTIEVTHGHGWEESPEAGWVFAVREGDGYRKFSITVADLGYTSDAEVERIVSEASIRQRGHYHDGLGHPHGSASNDETLRRG